jgi:hypothetical protein
MILLLLLLLLPFLDLLRRSFFRRNKQQEEHRQDLCLVGWLVTPLPHAVAEHALHGRKKTKQNVEKLGLGERRKRVRARERETPGQERENPRAKRDIFRASERQTHQSADK